MVQGRGEPLHGATPDQVIPLLQMVSSLLEKWCDRYLLQHHNLTTPQYMLLVAAAQRSDTTLGSLSEELGCSRGNITGIVDRLERDGWLVRERSSRDRRVITVRLTDKGDQVAGIRRQLAGELGQLACVWSDQERTQLTHILSRLYRELKET